MSDMKIVYAQQPFPDQVKKTIFLAGPTPRLPGATSWREFARAYLIDKFDGHVFIPVSEDGIFNGSVKAQNEWEEEGLNRADCIVFWIPRDMRGQYHPRRDVHDQYIKMPGLTTNDEWGVWKDSGKVVLGYPDWAEHIRYQQHYADKYAVPVAHTLEETLDLAIQKVGAGAERSAGECRVPLHIWNREDFQAWYAAQKAAGNRLDDARVAWTFQIPAPAFGNGPPKHLAIYGLHVNVHIGAENRNKSNEVVIFRKDIVSVLMYRDNKVVLVKEFRSPVKNSAGFVYELPGGSSLKPNQDPLSIVAQEVQEEVGIIINPDRFKEIETRQLAATVLAHSSKLFAVELTEEEMTQLSNDSKAHGEQSSSERTYVEVVSIETILMEQLVDWSMLGMIIFGLGREQGVRTSYRDGWPLTISL